MYNVGDALVGRLADLDTDALAAMLRAQALLGVRSDRVTEALQGALFEQMRGSRATAEGLSSSLLSLSQLSAAGLAAAPPRELLEAAGRMVSEHLGFFSVPQLCGVA